MTQVRIAIVLFASLCCAQEPTAFHPAAMNVWGAEYPRVDAAGRVQIRVKAPDANKVRLNFWSGPKVDMEKQPEGAMNRYPRRATVSTKRGPDGVTESETFAGIAFGHRRLERILCDCRIQDPHNILQLVLDELSAHSAGCPQADDITLVVLKVEALDLEKSPSCN